jgi:hypothetical protein
MPMQAPMTAPAPVASFPTAPASPATVPTGAPVEEQDPFWEAEPPPPAVPGRGEIYHSEFDEDQGVAQRATRKHRAPLIIIIASIGILPTCLAPLGWYWLAGLALAMIGWIFSGIALSMASSDLQDMSRNRMDRSGRQLTETGRYVGLGVAVVAGLAFCFVLLRFLASATL